MAFTLATPKSIYGHCIYIVFENFGFKEYIELMNQIISLLDDQYVCQSFNYRLLLKEFWIESPPHFKEEFVKFEIFLISTLFEQRNFTSDDLANINLILESASSDERHLLMLVEGTNILYNIILCHGDFKLADSLLKILDLNQEFLQRLKKKFIFNYFIFIMIKKDLNLFDKIFKWVVGSEEIEGFKEEIFHWLNDHPCYLFFDLEEETLFSFLNKILKWFLKTDEKIEEWKKNIIYSPLEYYREIEWLDQASKYRGHSQDEALVIKKDLLFGNLPKIAREFLNYANNRGFLIDLNVFFLCSYEKEKLREFTDHLRSFYEDCIKQKMCLECLNQNLVHGDGDEIELNCEDHGRRGFISLNEADIICSSLLNQFDSSLSSQEWRLQRINIF